MLEFRTAGFNPYAVKYSPYYDSRIAVASAANYGIVGNGRLFCLGLGPQGIFVEKTYVNFFSFSFLFFPPPFSNRVLTCDNNPDLTRTTRSTTSPGPRSTRTSCWWPAATAP